MKHQVIGAFEAKTHFSEILEKAHRGVVFLVTRRGRPVAQLGPTDARVGAPVFGSARGQVQISPDFNEPLTDMAGYET